MFDRIFVRSNIRSIESFVPAPTTILTTSSPTSAASPCASIDRRTAPSGVIQTGSSSYDTTRTLLVFNHTSNHTIHRRYDANAYCAWTIDVTAATSIALTFDSFDVEVGYDYLRVYNGTSLNPKPLTPKTLNPKP